MTSRGFRTVGAFWFMTPCTDPWTSEKKGSSRSREKKAICAIIAQAPAASDRSGKRVRRQHVLEKEGKKEIGYKKDL